jgi:hypothetical protein
MIISISGSLQYPRTGYLHLLVLTHFFELTFEIVLSQSIGLSKQHLMMEVHGTMALRMGTMRDMGQKIVFRTVAYTLLPV